MCSDQGNAASGAASKAPNGHTPEAQTSGSHSSEAHAPEAHTSGSQSSEAYQRSTADGEVLRSKVRLPPD